LFYEKRSDYFLTFDLEKDFKEMVNIKKDINIIVYNITFKDIDKIEAIFVTGEKNKNISSEKDKEGIFKKFIKNFIVIIYKIKKFLS
jgi:hypothetical protein